jgi:hypothetical protein
MINCKNQKKIQDQTKDCKISIENTIRCLSDEDEIDNVLFHKLLDAREALSSYWERNDLGIPRWN